MRYITTWRKPAPNALDWDYYVSETLDEARKVVDNVKRYGARQWHTYALGDAVADLSSEY